MSFFKNKKTEEKKDKAAKPSVKASAGKKESKPAASMKELYSASAPKTHEAAGKTSGEKKSFFSFISYAS